MAPTLQWSRALCAVVLLLSSVSCGPKVVVARLATPTAEVSRAAATATSPAKPQPGVPSPLPAGPVPTSPHPTPTATATATPRVIAREPLTTLTFSPSPRNTPTTPTAPPRPSPSATATRIPARPSPSPVVTATPTPIPPPTNTSVPPATRPATQVPVPSSTFAPAFATPSPTAPLIGEWEFRAEASQGVIAGSLRFRAVANGIAGTYAGLRGNTTELSNLRAAGDRISFDLVAPRSVWHLEGTMSGDRIEGTFQTAEHTIPWSAVRKGVASPSPTPKS